VSSTAPATSYGYKSPIAQVAAAVYLSALDVPRAPRAFVVPAGVGSPASRYYYPA